jgi:Na+/phosphate symporter
LQQRVRRRFRERDVRVGIDPDNPDHVVDAADQQLEKAVERIATAITLVQEVAAKFAGEEDAATLGSLQQATENIEQAIENMSTLVGTADEVSEPGESQDEVSVDDLERAAAKAEQAVEQVQTEIESTQVNAAAASVTTNDRVASINRRTKPRRVSRTPKRP